MRPTPSFSSRVHGCLLGGALADSLGYQIEGSSMDQIRADFGADGLTDFSQLPGPPHFTDDTQLTLYTVDGLLEAVGWANQGVPADEKACLWLAYLRWLRTQGEPIPASAPAPPPGWLDQQPVMLHRRGPGKACLSGLATGEMGTPARPVNPTAKGSGTVMRSAPFGLLPHVQPEAIFRLSADGAALTHGHPSAHQSAAAFSWIIHQLVHDGASLAAAAASALSRVKAEPSPAPELVERLETALDLAAGGPLPPDELTERLGGGWLAEECLAVGLYAAMVTDPDAGSGGRTPTDHFRSAVVTSVNHSGDSDTTGSVTGNLLGALYGEQALPESWLKALEGRDVIQAMADSFVQATMGGLSHGQ